MNKPKALPTLEYLNECFNYDPETGVLAWRERPASHFNDTDWRTKEETAVFWNAKYAGTEAGGVNKNTGYHKLTLGGKLYRSHRIAFKLGTGREPDAELNHINHDRADNRLCNLENSSRGEQCRSKRTWVGNKTGYVGVKETMGNRFEASCRLDGKKLHLGTFNTAEEAGKVAREWRNARGYNEHHCTEQKQV